MNLTIQQGDNDEKNHSNDDEKMDQHQLGFNATSLNIQQFPLDQLTLPALKTPHIWLNPDFLYYYQNIGIFSDNSIGSNGELIQEDWISFIKYLTRELPTTFRITSNMPLTPILQSSIKQLFSPKYTSLSSSLSPLLQQDHDSSSTCSFNSQESNTLNHQDRLLLDQMDIDQEMVSLDGKPDFPSPLSWYPNELAWQVSTSRKTLSHSISSKHFKHFLMVESEAGNISRQEAVSMIPPMLLDIHPEHRVLDICASPGSKTCQIIEMLHDTGQEGNRRDCPTGFIIANDCNLSRCYLLAHQIHRLASPAVLITNYEGQHFPDMILRSQSDLNLEHDILRFDRVLCDVPCTGDGTIRKNPSSGLSWDGSKPFKLHKLQLAIAKRSAQLLVVGGKMIYSTCSFNPIENEAVVAELLRLSNDLEMHLKLNINQSSLLTFYNHCYNDLLGALELIDCSNQLTELKRRQGLSTWKVIDRRRIYSSFESVPVESRQRILSSVFPPSEEEVANALKLDRCIRIYPHLQDTGGFFIAVIKKKEQTSFSLEKMDQVESPKSYSKINPYNRLKEDPFITLPPVIQARIIGSISEYYGLNGSPSEYKNLLIRSPMSIIQSDVNYDLKCINMIYMVTNKLHDMIERLERVCIDDQQGVDILVEPRIISAGIRFIENFTNRNNHIKLECDWRITEAGLPYILDYISRRVVNLEWEDFRILMQLGNPRLDQLSAKVSNELQNLILTSGIGVIVIRFKPEAFNCKFEWNELENAIRSTPQAIMGWLGTSSLGMAVNKSHMNSWKNLYTTPNYTHQFDPTIRKRPSEEQVALIQANIASKKLKDKERKEQVRSARVDRRSKRNEDKRMKI